MVDPIQRLILAFSRLPSIGEKSASRLTFFLLNQEPEITEELSQALSALHSSVFFCENCQNLSASNPCSICSDDRRNQGQICVVEDVSALRAIERTGEYRGLYHVLHGVFSPLDGVGPEDLKIAELLRRLQNIPADRSPEIIIATNMSIDGEATAMYLQSILSPSGYRLSRISSGIQVGTHLQYADQSSLAQSLLSRRFLN